MTQTTIGTLAMDKSWSACEVLLSWLDHGWDSEFSEDQLENINLEQQRIYGWWYDRQLQHKFRLRKGNESLEFIRQNART